MATPQTAVRINLDIVVLHENRGGWGKIMRMPSCEGMPLKWGEGPNDYLQ
jgi:hypothetical protein